MYAKAIAVAESGDFEAAVSSFKALGDFKDSPMMITYYTGRKYESQASASNWSPWITAAEYYDMVSYFLDSKTRAELHNMFFTLRDKYGITIVIVTHDKDLAAMSDRTLEMRDGQFI
jgi:hypothetical protein